MVHQRLLISFASVLLAVCYLSLAAAGQTAQIGRVTTAANLRAGPGITYALVGKAAPGQSVTIAGKNGAGDWYHLSNGQWIAAFLVTINTDPTVPASTVSRAMTPAPKTGVMAKRDANLRAGPGITFTLAGTVSAGQALTVTGQTPDNLWYQLAGGAWIAAFLVGSNATPATVDLAPLPSPTTPAPTTSGNDFVVVQKHLWDPYENGGSLDGPSVHCGQARELLVNVLDTNGSRINGVAVQVLYGAREIYVTGSQGKGDGVAEFVLGNGQDVQVIRDNDGHPVTSDVASGLSTDPHGIATDALIESHYCQDAATCQHFVEQYSCNGHFSWTVTFRRR